MTGIQTCFFFSGKNSFSVNVSFGIGQRHGHLRLDDECGPYECGAIEMKGQRLKGRAGGHPRRSIDCGGGA